MPDPDRSRPAPVPCPRRIARLRWRVLLVAPLLLLAAGSPAVAQTEPGPADKLVGLRLEWQRQVARQEVAAWEADVVSGPRGGGQNLGNIEDPGDVLKALQPALGEDYKAIKLRLTSLGEKARARRDEVQKDWAEVVRQRAVFRGFAEKQQVAYGFDFESGSQSGLKPDAFDAALGGAALVAVVIALQLRRKERRVDLRKAQRAAAAVLLVGMFSLPGCGGPVQSDGRAWADREEADLTEKVKAATAAATVAEAEADKKWQAAADAWLALVTPRKVDGKPDLVKAAKAVEEIVGGGERELRDRLRAVVFDSRVADKLAKDADEQRGLLADDKAKLDGLVRGAKLRGYIATGLRVSLAGLLFGLAISPFWSARRARAKRIRSAARTCPRCFRTNTLKYERAGAAKYTPAKGKGKKKKGEEEEEEAPEDGGDDGEYRCSKCDLRIRSSYLTIPRLCFPTVGVYSSGKTHMLVTAYDRIRKRTSPTVATVQPAPSGRDVDSRFAQLVEEIIHRRGVAGATDLVLPDPILIHLKDADPAGTSSALVNLFDYSGELINPAVDVNQLKDTAARMDGFMMFLDPTRLYGEMTLDTQLSYLDEFLAHMRQKRKVPVGQVIPVPVAVCIPKFDLLLSDNPIGGQSVQYIREMNENLSPPPRQTSYETVRERSELVEQMLPLMFPGADIRGVLEGYFGKQLMFFPMSSVSLFETELGVKDLSRRNINPYGVVEPILWLLHMHGYEVFA